MQIVEVCQKLEKYLASRASSEERVVGGVEALSRIFGVKRDEVAFFMLDPVEECFRFVWPAEMRNSGTIPANADRSLVAITARERKGIINNSFASTPHFFVFEKTAQIQKIMSAPMLKGNELRGVIQVSRKGTSTDLALRNFTQPEVDALCALANVIAQFL
ncbi:GAF domain-containing protein [Geomesophilobacter sediminis]|uniref:GAF domain-containing protein n=1 Tax=Geomesophilobacter sediminis TaxID=2798584 RepID=A0A8J7JMJ7_9BACT|nr:GAF domain-containing protein [Geomesophilobacter sediminis]MBJ6726045.1 GAF domain-containing protein [Geomesophilobacter sediminis]